MKLIIDNCMLRGYDELFLNVFCGGCVEVRVVLVLGYKLYVWFRLYYVSVMCFIWGKEFRYDGDEEIRS